MVYTGTVSYGNVFSGDNSCCTCSKLPKRPSSHNLYQEKNGTKLNLTYIRQKNYLLQLCMHNLLKMKKEQKADKTIHTFARPVDVAGFFVSTASRARHSDDRTVVVWFKQTFSLAVMLPLVTILAALAPSSPSAPVAVVCGKRNRNKIVPSY